MAGKIAVVTGANQGIGYEIVRLLKPALGASSRVVLCSRDRARGQQAIDSLREKGVEADLGILELTDKHSIESFAEWLRDTYGRVDLLINNAGFAFKQAATESFDVQARVSIDINAYGTLNVTKAVLPLMPSGSHIINISSRAGLLKSLSPEKQAQFTAADLTEEGVLELLEQFVSLTKSDQHRSAGYPGSAYGTSKIGMSALTRVWARTLADRGITVNAVCPGWCRTNMAGDKAPRSAEDGARTPVWLATTDGLGTGKFWADEQQIDW